MWWIFFEKYFEVKISEKIEIWKDLLEYLICEILFMIYQQKNDNCYRLGWVENWLCLQKKKKKKKYVWK